MSQSKGFVDWVDASGEFYAVHLFDRDTNEDGKVEGRVGEHGENEGDQPSVHLLDRRGVDILPTDEILAADRNSRFVVIRSGEEAWVFDAVTAARKPLEDVDLSSDGNACQRPRAVSFDVSGRWLGWMIGDERYRVRDLKTGAQHDVAAPQRLWRAEPLPHGWVAMKVVDVGAEFPREQTSCACQWCPRFARSIGRYGWSGESRSFLASPQGEVLALNRPLLPVSGRELFDLDSNVLVDMELPKGCAVAAVAFGASRLMLRCGGSLLLWTPESGATADLPDLVAPQSPVTLSVWEAGPISVERVRQQGQESYVEVNWETGAISPKPAPMRHDATKAELTAGSCQILSGVKRPDMITIKCAG